MKFTFIFTLFFSMLISSCGANENKNTQIVETKEDTPTLFTDNSLNREKPEKKETITNQLYNSRQNAITDAIKNTSPAVVGINVTEMQRIAYRDPIDEMFSQFLRRRSRPRIREYEVKGLGSGFLISSDGYILTNHHVAGNATKIIVTMTDGNEYEAEIIGSDYVTDVALLKIDGENFPFIPFCDSDDLLIGEWAIALGNPFGLFENNSKPTVTVGVVSNNKVSFIQEDQEGVRVYPDMVQTDAAISSGNSGGPLINAMGEVIGMNTIIYSTASDARGSGSIGIGFAIPINRIKEIVEILKKEGKINRNYYTGLDVRTITPRYAKTLGLDGVVGLLVYGISRNSPADLAGFEPGDVIVEIEGWQIADQEDYLLQTKDRIQGEKIEMVILRDQEKLVKELILIEPPRRPRRR